MRQRRPHRLERGDPAIHLGWKELGNRIAPLEQAHDVRRRGRSGQQRQIVGLAGIQEPVRRTGRDAKGGPGGLGGLYVFVSEQGAGAHDPTLDPGHDGDGLEGRRGPQRYLERGQSACNQRLGEIFGSTCVVNDKHGDDRRQGADLGIELGGVFGCHV